MKYCWIENSSATAIEADPQEEWNTRSDEWDDGFFMPDLTEEPLRAALPAGPHR